MSHKNFVGLLLCIAGTAVGQTRLDLRGQSRTMDFSNAPFTKPMRVANTLPGLCGAGEFQLLLGGLNNGRLYTCLSANLWSELTMPPAQNGLNGTVLSTNGNQATWRSLGGDLTGSPEAMRVTHLQNRPIVPTAPQTGQALIWNGLSWEPQTLNGLGQGAVTVKAGTQTVSTSAVANFVPGAGISIAITNVSGESRIQHGVDTATIETRARAQSGQALDCLAASADGLAYSCELTPALPTPPAGMVLHWRPQTNGAGGATTLNLGLTMFPVKLSDGTTDPAAANILAGQMYPVWFDGTNFRLLAESPPVPAPPAVTVDSGVRPACAADLRGRFWVALAAPGAKDTVAVCAKAANDTFDWRALY